MSIEEVLSLSLNENKYNNMFILSKDVFHKEAKGKVRNKMICVDHFTTSVVIALLIIEELFHLSN